MSNTNESAINETSTEDAKMAKTVDAVSQIIIGSENIEDAAHDALMASVYACGRCLGLTHESSLQLFETIKVQVALEGVRILTGGKVAKA